MKIDFNEAEILVLTGILGQYSDFINDNKDKIIDSGKIDPDTYCKIINNLKNKLTMNVLILCKKNNKLKDIFKNNN